MKNRTVKGRIKLIEPQNKKLGIRKQCELSKLHRSTAYHKPKGESQENEKLMKTMDRLFLNDPTLGVLGLQD